MRADPGSDLPGFRGILKQRYADFIVNEVDLDGNVVRLTTLEAPPEPVHVAVENETNASDQLNRSYDAEIESFRSLAGDSDADLLQSLIALITAGAEESPSPIVLSPNSDKIHRTAIHNYFKEKFKFLVTDTIDGPDASTKCIRVRVSSGGQSKGKMSKLELKKAHKAKKANDSPERCKMEASRSPAGGPSPNHDPNPNPNPNPNSIASSLPLWPTIDGPLGLSEEDAAGYARRFYQFGFALLPWLWAVNCFYFWPVLAHKRSFPQIRRYVFRSAIGFSVFSAILCAWALTFAIGGETLFGSVWNQLVMYNLADKWGLTGWD